MHTALPPLSLYIHFPWCVRKCPYCDFNSFEAKSGIPEAAYLAALRLDLMQTLPYVQGREIVSIFIGGGTPSLLSAAGLQTLLDDVRDQLLMSPDVEITMEANPGTFEIDKFSAYKASGVNRLSMGIQSFHQPSLEALGRVHTAEEARQAVKMAKTIFDNFNLDLMYGLPSQTLALATEDIQTALSFTPPHLSLYQLTLEPHTYFAVHPPTLPDEDTNERIQDLLLKETEKAGYQHYEISAYAQRGRDAKHNLNYWGFGDYLGIGPGAHAKITMPDRMIREVRYAQPSAYLAQTETGNFVQQQTDIDREDVVFEFMLNALRLKAGFNIASFTDRTGVALHEIESVLQDAQSKRLITRNESRIQPTALGWRFLNDLQELFL